MPSDMEKTSKNANLPFELIKGLNIEGIERSFKLAPKKLLQNRFLIGINKHQIPGERLSDICDKMNMPDIYREAFHKNLPDANIVLLGCEENEKSCIYKLYLEYWTKVKKNVRTKSRKKEPVLIYLGFKWDAQDNTKRTVAKYTGYPLLTVENIIKRIADLYAGHKDKTSFEITRDIINLAAGRLARPLFVYLEVTEENTPRKSFDINLYKANLQLKQLNPLLSKLSRHYAIPSEEFDPLYDRIAAKILGHLSGGLDREGKDFLTTYYEVDE